MKTGEEISFDEVNRNFEYDPLSGEVTWKFRPWLPKQINTRFAYKAAGSDKEGYRVSVLKTGGKSFHLYNHRIAWILMTGTWPDHEIDHIDRVRSNNRWRNLRPATRREQAINTIKSRTFHLPRGVSPHRNKFVVHIDGKYAGIFVSSSEAAAHYARLAEKHHGDFACFQTNHKEIS